MPSAINLEALYHYLSYKHVPYPLSAVEGRVRHPLGVRRPAFCPPVEMGEEDIVDALECLLRGELRGLLAGGSIPVLLSGGIDSGVVVGMAAAMSSTPLRTFHLTYAPDEGTEASRLEGIHAQHIAELYGTEHSEFVVRLGEIAGNLPGILRVIGEPFSGYMTPWFAARALSEHRVARVLTGDWGDELFGSYKAHRLAYAHPHQELWQHRVSTFVFHDEEKRFLFSHSVARELANLSTREHVKQYFQGLTALDGLNKMLESEFRSFYPDHTFLSFHLLTQYWGVEAASPYAQPRFADFAARIPGDIKMRGGVPKYILKKLAKRYLPDDIVDKPKVGFVTPTLNLCLCLEGYVRDALGEPRFGRHGLFDLSYVQQIADAFYDAPSETLAYKLWNLACFQVWYETCMGNRP